MADYFSGFDLNVRVEEEEDGNLPWDLNDGSGNHLLLVPFCFVVFCVRDGNLPWDLNNINGFMLQSMKMAMATLSFISQSMKMMTATLFFI